jgi:hypothetical protein
MCPIATTLFKYFDAGSFLIIVFVYLSHGNITFIAGTEQKLQLSLNFKRLVGLGIL